MGVEKRIFNVVLYRRKTVWILKLRSRVHDGYKCFSSKKKSQKSTYLLRQQQRGNIM